MGIFFWFLRPKSKLSAVTLRQIFEVFSVQALSKSSWRIILIVASKNEAVCCWVQTNLEVFALFALTPYEVYEESSWCIIMICASKNEAVCCEVQTHFESSPLARFTKKFLGAFHDLCVRKRSSLMWSSDAFWKFSACKFHRKSSAWNFTIHVSKYGAVSCEVQTQFGSFHLACEVYENSSGRIITVLLPKTKQFAVKFRRITEVFPMQAS